MEGKGFARAVASDNNNESRMIRIYGSSSTAGLTESSIVSVSFRFAVR